MYVRSLTFTHNPRVTSYHSMVMIQFYFITEQTGKHYRGYYHALSELAIAHIWDSILDRFYYYG